MDLTPILNQLLAQHNSQPIRPHVFRTEALDEFLKEAYRIRTHIATLYRDLKSIRQSYLSTAQPPRRKQFSRANGSAATSDRDSKYLTDAQRAEIDTQAKQSLRELNLAINLLRDAEQMRQETESKVALKKRAKRGLGSLGRWAAGGAITAKSPEEEEEESKQNTIKAHRESVILSLQTQLAECGAFQGDMMGIRLNREVEKSKSILYKNQVANQSMTGAPGMGTDHGPGASTSTRGQNQVALDESSQFESQLDPEQLQLFAQENQDMLKHHEDQLDKIRQAEKSLTEISELQTTLANNLSIQADQIEMLVEDSFNTTENVGTGNKQLKKATERRSYAQMVFWSTCAFCGTLVLWDLFI